MLSIFRDVIYPTHCCLCGDAEAPDGLCPACIGDLPLNRQPCPVCALPMDGRSRICGDCLQQPPSFDFVYSPFVYAQPLEWMIQQLKFNHQLHFAPLLARLMWMFKDFSLSADCFIPVPLHSRRLAQRGFNQSLLLARELSRLTYIPVDDSCCRRQLNTSAQTGQSASLRQRNIRGAFSYNGAHKKYRHVIVLDDVITTGSTVEELAKVLRQQGVERIDVWSVARAGRG